MAKRTAELDRPLRFAWNEPWLRRQLEAERARRNDNSLAKTAKSLISERLQQLEDTRHRRPVERQPTTA
jgi:hypothetical protein